MTDALPEHPEPQRLTLWRGRPQWPSQCRLQKPWRPPTPPATGTRHPRADRSRRAAGTQGYSEPPQYRCGLEAAAPNMSEGTPEQLGFLGGRARVARDDARGRPQRLAQPLTSTVHAEVPDQFCRLPIVLKDDDQPGEYLDLTEQQCPFRLLDAVLQRVKLLIRIGGEGPDLLDRSSPTQNRRIRQSVGTNDEIPINKLVEEIIAITIEIERHSSERPKQTNHIGEGYCGLDTKMFPRLAQEGIIAAHSPLQSCFWVGADGHQTPPSAP